MSYLSLSDEDKKAMLARIGAGSVEDLFCCLPESIRLGRSLNLPGPLSEMDLTRHLEALANRNAFSGYLSFLGGGAYPHFIPAVVDYLGSRGEFVSPYTPYQPEVSQGTLQVIFEFQTLVCQLTGLDIANASLYEGASAAAEAVLMAHRVKARNRVLLARSLHPQYRRTIQTYIRNLGLVAEEVSWTSEGRIDLASAETKMGGDVAAVVIQSPNFFGVCEDLEAVSGLAHRHQALSVALTVEALSLGLLEAPGLLGADIAAGEAQSFGIPISFGGPYLGFMACRKESVRQLPGRIAGQTVDVEGKRGYVLTLATREQHIRRERATSNICTNQALCALRAAIYMQSLGKDGLRELAWHNVQKAAYALDALGSLPGVRTRFSGPHFNEFVLEFSKPWPEVDAALRRQSILGGIELGSDYPELPGCVLVCVTETKTRQDIDALAKAFKEALS